MKYSHCNLNSVRSEHGITVKSLSGKPRKNSFIDCWVCLVCFFFLIGSLFQTKLMTFTHQNLQYCFSKDFFQITAYQWEDMTKLPVKSREKLAFNSLHPKGNLKSIDLGKKNPTLSFSYWPHICYQYHSFDFRKISQYCKHLNFSYHHTSEKLKFLKLIFSKVRKNYCYFIKG